MDFLPIPTNHERRSIDIPCLATEAYDDGDFKGYPERAGWNARSYEEWHNLFKTPPTKFLGFLQTWLLFAPLSIATGTSISSGLFTKISLSGEKVIDMSSLMKSLLCEPRPQPRHDQYVLGTICNATRLHTELCRRHIVNDNSQRVPNLAEFIELDCCRDPRDEATILGTAVLLELLWEYCLGNRICDHESGVNGAIGGNAFTYEANNPLVRKMREIGWCPYELNMLSRRLNTAGLYFIYHMERPNSNRQHKVIQTHPNTFPNTGIDSITASSTETMPGSAKGVCTTKRCSFLQLSDHTYQTKHADACDISLCYDMVADPQQVHDILKSGGIPLIDYIDSEDKSKTLRLISSGSDFQKSYVAISHVWSDGMGNVKRSALPRCQILRLSKLIRNLPGNLSGIHLFWIDTIGCPPDKAGQNEAQLLAITMMRETYENATAVLVLDSWLQTKPIQLAADVDILMAIICSAWNRRLWTLQEGALAKVLLFQFSDSAYDIDKGKRAFRENNDPVIDLTLKPTIFDRVNEVRGFREVGDAVEKKLDAIMGALAQRSTSVETDEALCIATLLGLNRAKITTVTQAPPADRMKVLWSQLEEISFSILLSSYQRLQTDNYRWAPKSFLQTSHVSTGSIQRALRLQLAKRTDLGIEIRCAGLLMAIDQHNIGDYFWGKDKDDIYYELEPKPAARDKVTKCDVTKEYLNEWANNGIERDLGEEQIYEKRIDLYPEYKTEILCFIFPYDINGQTIQEVHKTGIGFFASMETMNNERIYAKYLFPGNVKILRSDSPKLGRARQFHIEAGKFHHQRSRMVFHPGKADENGVLRVVGANKVGNEQEWFIR